MGWSNVLQVSRQADGGIVCGVSARRPCSDIRWHIISFPGRADGGGAAGGIITIFSSSDDIMLDGGRSLISLSAPEGVILCGPRTLHIPPSTISDVNGNVGGGSGEDGNGGGGSGEDGNVGGGSGEDGNVGGGSGEDGNAGEGSGEDGNGECSQTCYNIFIIETVCVAWFSLEFLLRFIQSESKCQFFRGPLNIIDALAILPYYVSLIVEDEQKSEDKPGGTNSYLEKISLVLRVLRALRILYVMRLARHSLGLQTLGLTARRCTREFGLLLLFLCVAVTLFAPLVHLAENEMGRCQEFTSVPASYWWAIISMTTVGYGDMVPRSVPGQVVALSSILSGILIMAFPATSIFHTFSRSYAELRRHQERLRSRLLRAKDASQSGESDTFNDTDSLGSEETYQYFYNDK
ncbi:PREDICTED: potassium voltage-gated channel subfamily G member 4-like [Nanorana parkeri]|uniref:potassium voltage-gated channel subfamily G member 4-like n=1 Tax=Nanorana parkeri TaxID=125878 RepID=UPI000853FA6D|nr:PREDICTED: potassium voltage-gated channel subfamily G member 4-like [Nanorana parkeri]